MNENFMHQNKLLNKHKTAVRMNITYHAPGATRPCCLRQHTLPLEPPDHAPGATIHCPLRHQTVLAMGAAVWHTSSATRPKAEV